MTISLSYFFSLHFGHNDFEDDKYWTNKKYSPTFHLPVVHCLWRQVTLTSGGRAWPLVTLGTMWITDLSPLRCSGCSWSRVWQWRHLAYPSRRRRGLDILHLITSVGGRRRDRAGLEGRGPRLGAWSGLQARQNIAEHHQQPGNIQQKYNNNNILYLKKVNQSNGKDLHWGALACLQEAQGLMRLIFQSTISTMKTNNSIFTQWGKYIIFSLE